MEAAGCRLSSMGLNCRCKTRRGGARQIETNLAVLVLPRLIGAAEDRGLRQRGGSGIIVIGLHDDVGADGVGAGGGGILSREVRVRRGNCVENCKLSPLTGSLVSTPHLRGRCSRWRLGRGADIQALLAGRRIEDRELAPTSTGHPRFGRKDEAEAIRRRRKRSSRESQRSNFESRTASDRRGRHRRGVRSL